MDHAEQRRVRLCALTPARPDLAGGDAFVVRVHGDSRRYKFTPRTDPSFDSAIYQCVLTMKKGECEEHRLPFKQSIPTLQGRVLSGILESPS